MRGGRARSRLLARVGPPPASAILRCLLDRYGFNEILYGRQPYDSVEAEIGGGKQRLKFGSSSLTSALFDQHLHVEEFCEGSTFLLVVNDRIDHQKPTARLQGAAAVLENPDAVLIAPIV